MFHNFITKRKGGKDQLCLDIESKKCVKIDEVDRDDVKEFDMNNKKILVGIPLPMCNVVSVKFYEIL